MYNYYNVTTQDGALIHAFVYVVQLTTLDIYERSHGQETVGFEVVESECHCDCRHFICILIQMHLQTALCIRSCEMTSKRQRGL